MERSTTHGEINDRIHTTTTATDESQIQRQKSPKSQTHINTTDRPGMRSDLAPWTETARGASRACSASASPPSGSPARRTPGEKNNTELRSDQQAAESNQIKSKPTGNPSPRIEPERSPRPQPQRRTAPLTLFFLASRAAAADAGDAASLFPITPCGECRRRTGALLPGRARRRACVRGEQEERENPKKRCGERREGGGTMGG